MQRSNLLVCAFLSIAISGTAFAVGDVLVYTGEGAASGISSFTNFGVATDKTVHYETTLPADLSVYDCVILPTNVNGFTAATLSALNTYTNSGGRLIAQAEHDRADGLYLGAIAAMNAVAANLGSDLSVVGSYLDCGFNVTNNIHSSPFTEGVNEIKMGCTSEIAVAVGPTAHSLVGTPTADITFIGADMIGSGAFFLLGDGNTLSDNSSDGYMTYDNGLLAANMCDLADFYIDVAIDLKPGSNPNCTNMEKGGGRVAVAILGTADFDPFLVDPDTVEFDGASPLTWAIEDVDFDGILDVVFIFKKHDMDLWGFPPTNCTEVELIAFLFDGTPIVGVDTLCNPGGVNCEGEIPTP